MFKGFSFAKIVAPGEYQSMQTAISLFVIVPFMSLILPLDDDGILSVLLILVLILWIMCGIQIKLDWKLIEEKRQAFFLFLQFTGNQLEKKRFGFESEEWKIFRYGTIYYLHHFLIREPLPFQVIRYNKFEDFDYFLWSLLQRDAEDIRKCRNDFWYRKHYGTRNAILHIFLLMTIYVHFGIRALTIAVLDRNIVQFQKYNGIFWKHLPMALILSVLVMFAIAFSHRRERADKETSEEPLLVKTHEKAFLLMLGKNQKKMEHFKKVLPNPEQFNLMERLIFGEEMSQTQWIAEFLLKENPALSAEEAERLAKQYNDSISKKVRDAQIRSIELWNIWSPYYFYDDKDNLTSRLLSTPYYDEASKKLRS